MELAIVLRKLLIIGVQTPEKRSELINHIVNLLTNLPLKNLTPLIAPMEKNKKIPENQQYEKHDMSAVYSILQFLQNKFTAEPVCILKFCNLEIYLLYLFCLRLLVNNTNCYRRF